MSATTIEVNDLIQLGRSGVNTHSRGDVYAYNDEKDQNDLLQVRDGVVFTVPDGTPTETIPLGSTTVIDGVEYTLTEVYNFWGGYTKCDKETDGFYQIQGQSIALTLEDDEGNKISFISPSDDFTKSDDWKGDPIDGISILSKPTPEHSINPGSDGTNKLSHDDDVTIPCFTAGTLIDTDKGRVPVESIIPGDKVLTRDKGYQPVRWVGTRVVTVAEMQGSLRLVPVCIKAGALGENAPEGDTYVSPEHRMLIAGQKAELMFGEREVLVAARDMVGRPGVEQVVKDVCYVHIMFNEHQIVFADGAWSESFQPGHYVLGDMDETQRTELFALFPELETVSGQQGYVAARMSLRPHEVTALFAA